MKKYFITIVNNQTLTAHQLNRTDENIDATVQKELGGWDNLRTASTSDRNLDNVNYQQAGTTKDGTKSYSILCVLAAE